MTMRCDPALEAPTPQLVGAWGHSVDKPLCPTERAGGQSFLPPDPWVSKTRPSNPSGPARGSFGRPSARCPVAGPGLRASCSWGPAGSPHSPCCPPCPVSPDRGLSLQTLGLGPVSPLPIALSPVLLFTDAHLAVGVPRWGCPLCLPVLPGVLTRLCRRRCMS